MKRDCSEQPLFCFYALYCSLKVTGTVYLQRTALSLQLPASILAWILQPVLLQHPVRGNAAYYAYMVYRTIFFNNHLYDYFTLCSLLFCAITGYFMLCQILQSRLSYLRGIQAYCLLSGIRGLLRQEVISPVPDFPYL